MNIAALKMINVLRIINTWKIMNALRITDKTNFRHYIDLSNKEHGYMPLRQDAYSAYNALLNLIQHFNRCFLEVEDE